MEVKRICQWCGKPFIAQKTTTCYCSPQCSKRGYKHRIKERKMELRHIQEMQELRSSLEKQEYFTFSQAARLMGVSRQYIYKLVKEDKLRASRISGRMALVRRADIELMLKSKPYERLVAKNDFNISEYYTAEEIQEKYGMTRVAIRSQVYRNNIPSKKEHGQIFYSKLHFDLSKSSEQESKAEYYTVKEAMGKFKLSRDSVYGILQFHQINREKNGRFVRFLKVEFDRVMGVRK